MICTSDGYTRCFGRTSVYVCASSLQNLVVALWNCVADFVFDGVGLEGFKSRANDFYWPNLLAPVLSSVSPFLFIYIVWYCGAGVFGLIRSYLLSSGLPLPTLFNNNNKCHWCFRSCMQIFTQGCCSNFIILSISMIFFVINIKIKTWIYWNIQIFTFMYIININKWKNHYMKIRYINILSSCNEFFILFITVKINMLYVFNLWAWNDIIEKSCSHCIFL